MMKSFLSVFLFAVFFDQVHSGCTFPNRLIGKWITGHDNGYDVITVNSTHMLGFSVGVITNLDFSCFIHDGQDTYAMRSSQDQNLLGLKVDIYICWHILSVSYDEFSVKELAHRVSQNSDEKGIAFLPGGSPSFSQICEPEDKTDKPRILYRRH